MSFAYAAGVITQTNEATNSITAAASGGINTVTFTCTNSYSNGDFVEIAGTTDYDGGWEVSNVTGTTFDVYYPEDPAITIIKGSSDGINFTSSQTGTAARGDKDFSAATSLSGVTTRTEGGRTIYTIDSSTSVSSTGALKIDPQIEHVVFDYTAANAMVATGPLQVGQRVLSNGVISYSRGDALTFNWNSVNNTGLGISDKFVWNGGRITLGSRLVINNTGSIVCTINKGTQYSISSSSTQFRVNYAGGDVYGLTLDANTALLRLFINSVIDTGVFKFTNGAFQTAFATAQDLTLRNFDIGENIAEFDCVCLSNTAPAASTIDIVNTTTIPSVDSGVGYDYYRVSRDISLDLIDINKNVISEYSIYKIDTDSGNRRLGPRYLTDATQNDTSAVIVQELNTSGTFTDSPLIYVIGVDQGETPIQIADDRRDGNGELIYKIASYGYAVADVSPELFGLGTYETTKTLLPDSTITETDRTVVDAYTNLETAAKLKDRSTSFQIDNYEGGEYWITKDGENLDLGSYDFVVDGSPAATIFNEVSGKFYIRANGGFTGNITTSGEITYLNDGIIYGLATDLSGSTQNVLVTAPNLIDGSRVQLYNNTVSAEIDNIILSGDGYTYTLDLQGSEASLNDELRLRATYVSGLTAMQELEATNNITAAGLVFSNTQIVCTIYDALAIDGSGITKFTADYINDDVDITVASNFSAAEFAAWWKYNLTTSQGISDFYGGLILEDQANFRIVNSLVNIVLDNSTSTNVYQTDNRRIYRDDDTRPVKDPTTGGGGVDVEWRSPVSLANIDQFLANQVVINNGVKNASIIVPHTTDL